jgi:group II intron reverse transcriptase/maturase
MKSFDISKQAVWDSYLKVKSNHGAAGVDQQSIEQFEEDLKDNLYKIWNRMSSGSYFPPPVLRVEIPKGDGKMRQLGIPTVADRIAQMVVKNHIEPELETIFHPDSYGYRPKRSAKQALAQARQRCWKCDWVVDMDIKGFFDNISHDLMMRAVRKHTEDKWVLLYVERWLKAPVQLMNGEVEERTMGTPQGGVISPLLANLFLHYAFDYWMQSNYPSNPFERYADDVVAHCCTEAEAIQLKTEITKRMEQCGLELHPEKTKIVYCKDANRKGNYPIQNFDFLGFCFRPRLSRNRRGQYFVNFSPAIAPKSKKAIFEEIRRWRLHKRSDLSIKELANWINPVVRGWVGYYGAFFQSELLFLVRHLDKLLYRWVIRKYKKQGSNFKKTDRWVKRVKREMPNFFVHWSLLRA